MLGIPALTQGSVNHLIDRAARGETSPWTVRILRAGEPLMDLDKIVWAYDRERDPVRQEAIKKTYKELTGGDVETRLWQLKY